ncbi:MAG: alpha/beta hydrolase [Pleurocapsa sp.]
MIKGGISLILGISAALLPIKAIAAERIAFDFSLFGQFYVEVDDLDTFVKTGKVSNELAYYLDRLPSIQVDKLPVLLSTPLELKPLTIAKFSNSAVGETVIKNFGKGIRGKTNRIGFLALRGAIIAASFDDQGLTIINLLHKFPLKTIYIDFKVVEQYISQGEKILKNRKLIDDIFFSDNIEQNKLEQITSQEISGAGIYNWQKEAYTYRNPHRSKTGYFDLYLPEKKQSPLIVISHGVASSRQTFTYLGEHLASHGFAVAIVEHDDISLKKFDDFLSGMENFPEPNNLIDQPLDIKYVLDKLEQELGLNSLSKSKINLQQVGVIGHSFGGYTSLVLGGGKLIADSQAKQCQEDDYQDVLLDLSSLAKCTFNEFSQANYQLKDPRIKAIVAINPMGRIFGKSGMSFVNVPTMFISGTNDLIMPPLAEQIEPFSWLNNNIDKYLVLVKPGTHFSFLREGLGVFPVPDTVVGISPTQAYHISKALTTAFFQTYLNQQKITQEYLQGKSLNLLHNSSFQLSIIDSLNDRRLQKLLENLQK